MTYKIVPKETGVFTASDVIEDVKELFEGRYIYYVFLGNHVTYTTSSDVPLELNDKELTFRDAYNKMLFGKRVTEQDVSIVVPRYNYISQRVYAAYDDDSNTDIFTTNFFVTVKRGSEYDVFKCLDNYNGSPSTVAPDKSHVNPGDEIYRTSDNYVWKYMYTIPSATMDKFGSTEFVPIVANTVTEAYAVNGAIDVVKVDYGGARYDNYLYGSIGSSDLNVDGNPFKVNVSGNTKSSTASDFYKDCVFKVISGTGSGSFANVIAYSTSGTNRVVTLDKVLTLDLTSHYEITPAVLIEGDYNQTVNAFGRAVINSVANSVDYVEILNRGEGYRTATATVLYNSVVPVALTNNQASVRPIMSPKGGHGSDPAGELGGSRVCFSVTFNETVDQIPSINDFRQVGILTNPKFSEVHVDFSSKSGSFLPGETVYQVNPVQVYGNLISVSSSSNSVTASDASFTDLAPNTFVYLVSNDSRQLAKIYSVTNGTTLVLDSVGAFSCSDTKMYLANVSGPATVSYDVSGGVVLTEVFMPYDTGSKIIGKNSGAYGVVDNLTVSDNLSTLNTFNQMWKYHVTTGDTFEPDEVVVGTDNASNAHGRFFGLVGTSPKVMYVSDQSGIINNGETIRGANSNKTAVVNDKFQPDLIYNSGRIVYLENLETVSRSSGQKETFKIVFEF